MSATKRRLAIWYTLCIRRKVTIGTLAEMFQVSKRTIRYDIEALSLNHPIETVCGRYTGGVKLSDWYIPTKGPLDAKQMEFLFKMLSVSTGADSLMLYSIIEALTSGKEN